MITLKPLAYGYMRVPDDIPDRKIRDMEQKLKDYPGRLGFEFATFFYEFQCGTYSAWDELTMELQRADAHHVIVPSMIHIAQGLFSGPASWSTWRTTPRPRCIRSKMTI